MECETEETVYIGACVECGEGFVYETDDPHPSDLCAVCALNAFFEGADA